MHSSNTTLQTNTGRLVLTGIKCQVYMIWTEREKEKEKYTHTHTHTYTHTLSLSLSLSLSHTHTHTHTHTHPHRGRVAVVTCTEVIKVKRKITPGRGERIELLKELGSSKDFFLQKVEDIQVGTLDQGFRCKMIR